MRGMKEKDNEFDIQVGIWTLHSRAEMVLQPPHGQHGNLCGMRNGSIHLCTSRLESFIDCQPQTMDCSLVAEMLQDRRCARLNADLKCDSHDRISRLSGLLAYQKCHRES